MPWLSRSPSPTMSPRVSFPTIVGSSPVTYIPPLIDGACGTMPRFHFPAWTSMRNDAVALWKIIPTMFWAALGDCSSTSKTRTWEDCGDILANLALAVIESHILVAMVPLWMVLPGALFAMWMMTSLAVAYCFTRLLNGTMREQIIQCSTGSDGWMMGQEADDERWIFVGGMGLSLRELSRSTLPMLSKLFCRSMTAVHMPTYGIPFDLISLLVQRAMVMPTPSTRILYNQVRAALVDPSIQRVAIIAHNTGAVSTSQIISLLCTELSVSKVSKLEVYTFGAAAHEFVIPLGEPMADQQPGRNGEPRKTVHIEHFALSSDPFAQFGVLQSVRQSLVSRFCGGVFALNGQAMQIQNSDRKTLSGLSMHDYMEVLFPSQLANGQSTASSALESIMTIDRDLAEKREFAAISNHASSRSSKENKRLSWTALGATAGDKNGVSDGVVGLEMARRGCRDCDGHRGSEVSWLLRYVHIGTVPVFRDTRITTEPAPVSRM